MRGTLPYIYGRIPGEQGELYREFIILDNHLDQHVLEGRIEAIWQHIELQKDRLTRKGTLHLIDSEQELLIAPRTSDVGMTYAEAAPLPLFVIGDLYEARMIRQGEEDRFSYILSHAQDRPD